MEDLNLRQKNHFDSIANEYYQYRNQESHIKFKHLIWKDFFKKNRIFLNQLPKSINVLEPMCGFHEGYKILTENLSNINNYLGFDYSSKVVKIARKEYPDLKIEEADICKFKTNKRFNFGILIGGLHHVSNNLDLAIENICQYYENNAYLINLEPTHEFNLIKLIRNYIYKKNSFFDEKTESGIELKKLNDLFNRNGFKLLKNHRIGYIGYILFYNPDAFKIFSKLPSNLIYIIRYLDKIINYIPILRKLSFATMSIYIKKE